jgi:hypothetical protein
LNNSFESFYIDNTEVSFPISSLRAISHNVERTAMLQQLESLLSSPSAKGNCQSLVLLHGLPGAGKSQLARQYATRWCQANQYYHFFDASTSSILEQAYSTFAVEAGLIDPALRVPSPKILTEKVINYLSKLTDSWLLVFDNFDLASADRYHISDYFPERSNGQIIVTSRNRESVEMTGGTALQVTSMTDVEAVALLEKAADLKVETSLETDESQAILSLLKSEVATGLLGSLPLAIAQAGAYIRHRIKRSNTKARLLEYRRLFQEHHAKLLKDDDHVLVARYGKSIITSLDICFRTVAADNSTAAELLLLFGFLHHSNIPKKLFEIVHQSKEKLITHDHLDLSSAKYSWCDEILATDYAGRWDTINIENALALLESYSLILYQDEQSWSLHPLVHSWTTISNTSSRETLEARAQIALCMIAKVQNSGSAHFSHTRKSYEELFSPHTVSCLQTSQRYTQLLEPMADSPLDAATLLQLSLIASQHAVPPELKARKLELKLVLTAVISGAKKDGLDAISTLRSFRNLLINLRPYNRGVSAELMPIVSKLFFISASKDSTVNIVEEQRSIWLATISFTESIEETEKAIHETFLHIEKNRSQMGETTSLRHKIITFSAYSLLLAGKNPSELQKAYSTAVQLVSDAETVLDQTESWYHYMSKTSLSRVLQKLHRYDEAQDLVMKMWLAIKSAQDTHVPSLEAIIHDINLMLLKSSRYKEIAENSEFALKTITPDRGPYHEDCILQMRLIVQYNREALGLSTLVPSIFGVHHCSELDTYVTLVLELAVAYKAFGTPGQITALWEGVLKQKVDEDKARELIPIIPSALGFLAAAGDVQGYRDFAVRLRAQAEELEALQSLKQNDSTCTHVDINKIKIVWDRLEDLYQTFIESGASKSQAKGGAIIEHILDTSAIAQRAMLFLANHFIQWILNLDASNTSAPFCTRDCKTLYNQTEKHFGSWKENFNSSLAYQQLILVYRLEGKDKEASDAEDLLVQSRISEKLTTPHYDPTHIRLLIPSTVTLERLLNEYRRRKLYKTIARLYKVTMNAFWNEFGLTAEATIMELKFVFECYGHLKMIPEIKALLSRIQEEFDHSSMQRKLTILHAGSAIYDWCNHTESFEAAYHIVIWTTKASWPYINHHARIKRLKDFEFAAKKTNRLDDVQRCIKRRRYIEDLVTIKKVTSTLMNIM